MTQMWGADTGKAAEVTYATIRRQILSRRARRWGVAARGRPRRGHRREPYAGARGPAPPRRGRTGPARAQPWRAGRGLGGRRPGRDLQPPLTARAVGVRPRRDQQVWPTSTGSAGWPTGWTRRRDASRPTSTRSPSSTTEFHRTVLEASGNGRLVGMVSSVVEVPLVWRTFSHYTTRGHATEPGAPPRARAGARRGRRPSGPSR